MENATPREIENKHRRRRTIFRQILLSITVPISLVLLTVSILNYIKKRDLLEEANKERSEAILAELNNLLLFQNVSLGIVEHQMVDRNDEISTMLVDVIFKNTGEIESTDLDDLMLKTGMNPDLEDIYVIKEGKIVNSTVKADLGLDFYSFGPDWKSKLMSILTHDSVVVDPLSIEGATKRLKKFSYQSTKDKQYIIEVGVYSAEANDVFSSVKDRLRLMSKHNPTIVDVNLFLKAGQEIYGLKESELSDSSQFADVENAFSSMEHMSIYKDLNNVHYDFEYYPMESEEIARLGGEAVIQIVVDKTKENDILNSELIQVAIYFTLALILIFLVVFQRARSITKPVKNLVSKMNVIREGNLSERASLFGNNEITTLADQFNMMVENLEEAQKQLTEKNEEIMDSIRYAKRIQTAILPSDQYIDMHLEKAYVLFKPKDIVSGDFYWMDEVDGKVFFGAFDCTGHGVPGAMVSVVGNNGLNRCVREFGLTEPAKILDKLAILVEETFHIPGEEVKDGMDAGLLAWDPKTRVLEFAGANNPLYYFRNGELEEIKANKQPIGAYADRGPFTNHRFETQPGDYIVTFSDGYADQFGGPKGKKLKYKPFKQILLDNLGQEPKVIHDKLDETFEAWRGDHEQVDDVCVIGVQF